MEAMRSRQSRPPATGSHAPWVAGVISTGTGMATRKGEFLSGLASLASWLATSVAGAANCGMAASGCTACPRL